MPFYIIEESIYWNKKGKMTMYVLKNYILVNEANGEITTAIKQPKKEGRNEKDIVNLFTF